MRRSGEKPKDNNDNIDDIDKMFIDISINQLISIFPNIREEKLYNFYFNMTRWECVWMKAFAITHISTYRQCS